MTDEQTIEIRMLSIEDGAALTRLAQLDTASTPAAPVLGGIVDGRLVAAHSTVNDESIADPFHRTAEIRTLLAQRAGQLRGGHGRGLLSRLRGRLDGELGSAPGATSEAIR